MGPLVGVNLRELFPQHAVQPEWYSRKRIAIDGHNVAFRYLTSIRTREGDVVRSEAGRPISHLIGFLGLVRTLRAAGAEPIVIWDGDVHPRKQATVDERIRKREEAVAKAEAAKVAGDHDAYVRAMRSTVYLDQQMIDDCTSILEPLGVAVARADHDGERYAAALCHEGHADAVATEDFDALVAGAPTVLRKAGGASTFLHRLSDVETHGLSLEQLQEIAIVCGTDWHPGVKGFGPKTALKALRQYDSLERIFEEADAGRDGTRFHRLVAACDLDLAGFQDLKAYVANVPQPEAPRSAKPCPEVAAAAAEDLGVSRERVLACFC